MITVGIIGYGYWGPNLLRTFSETTGVTVDCVADINPKRLEIVQKRYPSVKATTRFQDILENKGVNAIAVATPVSTHFELGMAILKAGKHLWLEKPMTETSYQAHMLVDEAEKRQRVLIVDHTFLYTGAVRKIADVVKSGELGNFLYYDSTRINLGLFQRDVCVIADLAVHDFSILDYLVTEQPASVSAVGINHFVKTPENLAYITLFYDSGIIAHINVSWLAPVKIRQVLIGGTEKMVIYNDLEPSEKINIYDKGVKFTEDPNQIYERRVGYRTGDMLAPKLDETEALRVEADHFVDCIENGKAPITDGLLGKRVVGLIEASIHSMKDHGRPVHVNGTRMWRGRAVG